jgi:hypothetical protein
MEAIAATPIANGRYSEDRFVRRATSSRTAADPRQPIVAASATRQRTAIVVKFALRLAGALALLGGVAFVVVGCLIDFRLPGDSDVSALSDALDTIAIGAFGALFGAGLIVHAGQASKHDA